MTKDDGTNVGETGSTVDDDFVRRLEQEGEAELRPSHPLGQADFIRPASQPGLRESLRTVDTGGEEEDVREGRVHPFWLAVVTLAVVYGTAMAFAIGNYWWGLLWAVLVAGLGAATIKLLVMVIFDGAPFLNKNINFLLGVAPSLAAFLWLAIVPSPSMTGRVFMYGEGSAGLRWQALLAPQVVCSAPLAYEINFKRSWVAADSSTLTLEVNAGTVTLDAQRVAQLLDRRTNVEEYVKARLQEVANSLVEEALIGKTAYQARGLRITVPASIVNELSDVDPNLVWVGPITLNELQE